MAIVGGPVQEIAYNHPTIGSGFLYPKGDADATIDFGGYRKADDDNGVDGAGRGVYGMMPRRWSVETTIANDTTNTRESLTLNRLAAAPEDAVFTFTLTSGAIYRGTGTLVGDIQDATQTSTLDVKFAGGGTLKPI